MEFQRQPAVTPAVLGLYFFPLLLSYFFLSHPKEERIIFIIGIVTIVLCSLILFLLLKKYEIDVQEGARLQVVDYQKQTLPTQRDQEEDTAVAVLQDKLNKSEIAMESLKKEREWVQRRQEHNSQEKAALEEEQAIRTQEVEELKLALEKSCQFAVSKEEQIATLKSEISNLQFELRTLVRLDQTSRESQRTERTSTIVPRGTSVSAATLLDDAVHTALLLAESGQLKGSTSRVFDFSSEALAIENRRLFETLQELAVFPLFVLCKKEQKLLFACGPFHKQLGWTLEELQRDFFSSLVEGKEELQRVLKEIYPFETKKVTISLSGKRMNCVLGLCPLPPFSQCVIAIADISSSYKEPFATVRK